MNNLVNLNQVTKKYGDTNALDQVNLDIPSGRIVGLIGPNGAGKTTLLRALTGLIDYEGSISILDVEPKENRHLLMENIGVIHDISVLPPWMTVEQVLEFQIGIHSKFDKTDLNDWLEIGVLGEILVNGKMEEIPIYLEKVIITDSLTTFTVQVDQKPIKAGIDPMHKFVDRDSDDNLVRVSIQTADSDDSEKLFEN